MLKYMFYNVFLFVLIMNFSLFSCFCFSLSNPFLMNQFIGTPSDEKYNNKNILKNHPTFKIQSYVIHNPISISGNTDFHTQAASEGWNTGGRDGTYAKPYLITNLNISLSTSSTSSPITIYNTDIYFVAENNLFIGGYYGVYLSNVRHGGISFNVITDNRYRSIFLTGSSFNTFISNQVGGAYDAYNQRGDGMYFSTSHNNSIINNQVFNNIQNGIEFYYSQNNTVKGNYVYDNSDYGIALESMASNNTLSYNVVYDNGIFGFKAGNFNKIVSNDIYNHLQTGLQLGSSSVITNNRLWNNSLFGISGSGVELNNISYNSIFDMPSGTGIYLYSNSRNNTISGNSIYDNFYGIQIEYSSNNSLINNQLVNNVLKFDGSTISHFLQDDVFGNTINGKPIVFLKNIQQFDLPTDVGQIFLINTSQIFISHLVITNFNALFVAFSNNINIFDNSFSFGLSAIEILYSHSVRILNNNIFNCSYSGIYIYQSYDISIYGNEIHHNNILSSGLPSGGIYIYYSNYTQIFKNIFDQNIYFNLYIGQSYYNNITNNVFSTGFDSIVLSEVHFSIITTNDIFNNSKYGIYAYYLYNCTIVGNSIYNNTEYGLLSFNAFNSSIIWNNLVSNNVGSGKPQIYNYLGSTVFLHNYFSDWNGTGSYLIDGSTSYDTFPENITHIHSIPEILFPIQGVTIEELITVSISPTNDSANHTIIYYMYYSVDGGLTWNIISRSTSKDIFLETRFFKNRTDYKLRIISIDQVGAQTEDISSVFSISNIAHTLSLPTIVNPNESKNVSGIIALQWVKSIDTWHQNVTYAVYYSNNTGSSWYLLASNLSSNIFFWNTSDVTPGSNYLVRIVAFSTGIFGELRSVDISDSVFSIVTYSGSEGVTITIEETITITQTILGTITTISEKTTTMSQVSTVSTSGGSVPGFTFMLLAIFIPFVVYFIKNRREE